MKKYKKWVDEERVGTYGSLPVIADENGKEWIAEEYFLNDDGSCSGQTVCQSRGCDYCHGNFEGCRFSDKNVGKETDWFY